jgi:hypothetical protein
MNVEWKTGGLVLALCLASVLQSQDDKQPPISVTRLIERVSSPEAEHPSEEIVADIRKLSVEFEITPQLEAAIRAAAETAKRPDDLTRQIMQAARENWIFDRVRLLTRKKEELPKIAELVRERGVRIPYTPQNEQSLIAAGADEPALTLLWPPVEPLKPRQKFQEWLTPKQNMEPVPLEYDPNRVRGEVEVDAVVDGKVLLVLKHDTIFYDVICGGDLQLTRAHWSAPLPRLPLDRWEYRLDLSRKKPRGRVFACPQDPQCHNAGEDVKRSGSERLCSWEDPPTYVDEHGYPNARFVIDDYQSGQAAYDVVFQWAMKPYTLEWFAEDAKRIGLQKTRQRAFNRGVFFGNDATTKEVLRAAGLPGDDPYEALGLGRVVRRTNLPVQKVH